MKTFYTVSIWLVTAVAVWGSLGISEVMVHLSSSLWVSPSLIERAAAVMLSFFSSVPPILVLFGGYAMRESMLDHLESRGAERRRG